MVGEDNGEGVLKIEIQLRKMLEICQISNQKLIYVFRQREVNLNKFKINFVNLNEKEVFCPVSQKNNFFDLKMCVRVDIEIEN